MRRLSGPTHEVVPPTRSDDWPSRPADSHPARQDLLGNRALAAHRVQRHDAVLQTNHLQGKPTPRPKSVLHKILNELTGSGRVPATANPGLGQVLGRCCLLGPELIS
jgi:hypothetical protein